MTERMVTNYCQNCKELADKVKRLREALNSIEWQVDIYGDYRCSLCDCLYPEHNARCLVGLALRGEEVE